MRRLMVTALVVSTVLLSPALAETEDGGYAGAFLQLGLSARAVGIGQAYYAVADDATAIFYNPGGAAQVKKRTVGFSYRVMDLDRRLGYASVNLPIRNEATISLGWIFAGVGDVVERNTLGEPGDELACSENVLSVCFARRFSNIVSIGGTGKFHISKLANITTTTVGFDIGTYIMLTKGEELGDGFPVDALRIGGVVGNLAASYIWTTGDYWGQYGQKGDSKTDDFPLLIGGGVSALALDSTLLVALDVRKYKWHSASLHTGAEYMLGNLLRLRAGLDDVHPTFGFGVERAFAFGSGESGESAEFEQTPPGRVRLTIDYGFSSSRAAERPDHIFSVGFAF